MPERSSAPAIDMRAARAAPLAAFQVAFAAASVPGLAALGEIPFLAQIGLRGDPADPVVAAAVRAATGLDMPASGVVTSGGARALLWLGPDEALLVAPDGEGPALVATLEAALGGAHAQAVDLSASRAVIALSGARAREVLNKGLGLDLHPRAFGPGRCAQTMLARAPVLLQQVDDAPTFHLYVRNSFASYLATWLLDAVAEVRLPPLPAR
jgi:sarcosine oxidase subunit gamma